MTPHVRHREVLDIASYKPLMDVIRELHGMEMGLIFTLSGFKSTKRGWHQDAYLDDDSAIPRLASWIACGDVDADCGPFQYIPGSHRWAALSNKKINSYLKDDYQWPPGHVSREAGEFGWGRISEAFIDPAVFRKIKAEGHAVHEFTAQRGCSALVRPFDASRFTRASAGRQRPGLIGHCAAVRASSWLLRPSDQRCAFSGPASLDSVPVGCAPSQLTSFCDGSAHSLAASGFKKPVLPPFNSCCVSKTPHGGPVLFIWTLFSVFPPIPGTPKRLHRGPSLMKI